MPVAGLAGRSDVVLDGKTVAPVVGKDTMPVVATLNAVVAPLLPTLSAMLSLVPAPEVDCNVREDEAVVPPT